VNGHMADGAPVRGRKVLLTGRPGVGKTTVLVRLAALLGREAAGFYTAEVREADRRVGFEIVTLGGERAVLADAGSVSRYRVGKYGVEVDNLALAVGELERALGSGENTCLLIDEIGKMELFSPAFREIVRRCFAAPNPVVATIMAKPHPFCDALKNRPGVRLVTVTPANRDRLPRELLAFLKGSAAF